MMAHESTMLPASSFQYQYGLVLSTFCSCQHVKSLIKVYVAVPQIFRRSAGAAVLSSCSACSCKPTLQGA